MISFLTLPSVSYNPAIKFDIMELLVLRRIEGIFLISEVIEFL
jgi:hypothetical protein